MKNISSSSHGAKSRSAGDRLNQILYDCNRHIQIKGDVSARPFRLSGKVKTWIGLVIFLGSVMLINLAQFPDESVEASDSLDHGDPSAIQSNTTPLQVNTAPTEFDLGSIAHDTTKNPVKLVAVPVAQSQNSKKSDSSLIEFDPVQFELALDEPGSDFDDLGSQNKISDLKPENPNLTPDETAIEDFPEVPIAHGEIRQYNEDERDAPLEIVTPDDGKSYFFKMVDALTNEPVMTIFIKGGQKFKSLVPLGNYRIKYATGSVWNGEAHLFGPATISRVANRDYNFYVRDDKVIGHSIAIILRRDGEPATKLIPKYQF